PPLFNQLFETIKLSVILANQFNKSRKHRLTNSAEQRTQHLLSEFALELFTVISGGVNKCLSLFLASQIPLTVHPVERCQYGRARDHAFSAKALFDLRDGLIRLLPEHLHHFGLELAQHLFDPMTGWAESSHCDLQYLHSQYISMDPRLSLV